MFDFGITYTTPTIKRMVGRFVSPTTITTFEKHARSLAFLILSPDYSLSLVFVDEKKAQALNIKYRGKDYTPNVLSFPLSPTAGEIYICPKIAEQQAAEYNHTAAEHLRFLFIHGCLHLTGLDHGAKMDRLEKKYMGL
jgi:probable rRNA maturation factor